MLVGLQEVQICCSRETGGIFVLVDENVGIHILREAGNVRNEMSDCMLE